MPKRKGADKLRHTVQDIAKILLNLEYEVNLPIFYAIELARLPAIDVSHCDISAILIELQALRAEVRDMKCLQVEVHQLRQLCHRMSVVPFSKVQEIAMGSNGVTAAAEVNSDSGDIDVAVKTVAKCPTPQLQRL